MTHERESPMQPGSHGDAETDGRLEHGAVEVGADLALGERRNGRVRLDSADRREVVRHEHTAPHPGALCYPPGLAATRVDHLDESRRTRDAARGQRDP
jgi:hypothetical protein